MEGVKELIIRAKSEGLKLAIATSATRKKPVTQLKRLGLLDYFDAFSTAELSENIKPAPDIFLKAAELLDCKPEECLAVEDAPNGLKSALGAGCHVVMVPDLTGAGAELEGRIDAELESLRDLPGFLERMA